MQATLLRSGMVIRHGGDLFTAHQVEHRTPGNKRGFMQARMRNLRTGALVDIKFRSDDELERVILDESEMQFLFGTAFDRYIAVDLPDRATSMAGGLAALIEHNPSMPEFLWTVRGTEGFRYAVESQREVLRGRKMEVT